MGRLTHARRAAVAKQYRLSETSRKGKRMRYKSRLIRNRARPQLPNGTSAEPRRITKPEVRGRRMEFRLDCGRDVLVEEIRITSSTLGYIAGSKDAIRDDVIKHHPERVREQFPGHGAFLIKPTPEGALPAFIIIVALVSQPVCDPAADFSSLVFSWLSDDLDSSLPELIGREIQGIPWDMLAVDGKYLRDEAHQQTSHETRLLLRELL